MAGVASAVVAVVSTAADFMAAVSAATLAEDASLEEAIGADADGMAADGMATVVTGAAATMVGAGAPASIMAVRTTMTTMPTAMAISATTTGIVAIIPTAITEKHPIPAPHGAGFVLSATRRVTEWATEPVRLHSNARPECVLGS